MGALVNCDPVTGILNHRRLLRRLEAEIARATRTKQTLTVVRSPLKLIAAADYAIPLQRIASGLALATGGPRLAVGGCSSEL